VNWNFLNPSALFQITSDNNYQDRYLPLDSEQKFRVNPLQKQRVEPDLDIDRTLEEKIIKGARLTTPNVFQQRHWRDCPALLGASHSCANLVLAVVFSVLACQLTGLSYEQTSFRLKANQLRALCVLIIISYAKYLNLLLFKFKLDRFLHFDTLGLIFEAI